MRPQQAEKRATNGYAIAFASTFILSTTGALVRQLPSTPPNFWCNIFLGTFLFLVLELFYPFLVEIRRRDWGPLLLNGLLLSIFNILWTASVEINGAASAILLGYSSAGITILLGRYFQNNGVGHAGLWAILFGLTGCALSSGLLGPGQAGIMVGVLSGLGYGIYSLMGLCVCNRGLSPWTILLYSFGLAALFLYIFGAIHPLLDSPQFFFP